MSENKPRLGIVTISYKYVVDLDNEDMVNEAKQAIFEDISGAANRDELWDWIKIEAAPEGTKEDEIAYFLVEDSEESDEFYGS